MSAAKADTIRRDKQADPEDMAPSKPKVKSTQAVLNLRACVEEVKTRVLELLSFNKSPTPDQLDSVVDRLKDLHTAYHAEDPDFTPDEDGDEGLTPLAHGPWGAMAATPSRSPNRVEREGLAAGLKASPCFSLT